MAHEDRRESGPAYTPREERANAVTHWIGVSFAVCATVLLSVRAADAGDVWKLATYPVFGLSMVILYTASALYHSIPGVARKRRLRIFDHVSIYYLIAGTYTPVSLVGLRDHGGWAIFAVIWALAAAGTIYTMRFAGRFPAISTAIYVAMGWTAIFAVVPLVRTFPIGTLLWILGGGVAYTAGVGFYAWKRLPYNHAVWHLFVLAGSACHVVAVWGL